MFRKDTKADYKMDEVEAIFKQLNPYFQDFILDQSGNSLNTRQRSGKRAEIAITIIIREGTSIRSRT
jgi:hypothetical protein